MNKNPLQVDFGAIIEKAERRRASLEAITDMISREAVPMAAAVETVRGKLNVLTELWCSLDREGRELLPPPVRTFLDQTQNHSIYLSRVQGYAQSGARTRVPGLSDLADFVDAQGS